MNNDLNNNNRDNIVQSNVESVQNSTNQFTQTFQDETMKKKERMAEIGFLISIFG